MRTWPPMCEEERAILSLPPKMQKRMAVLTLKGWRFERVPGVTLVCYWRAHRPDTDAYFPGATLLTLLDKLVGYDADAEDDV